MQGKALSKQGLSLIYSLAAAAALVFCLRTAEARCEAVSEGGPQTENQR